MSSGCAFFVGDCRNGNVRAIQVKLVTAREPERCQGVVCSMKDGYGFIERADVVKEIFFHYSEYDGDVGTCVLGEDVEFTVQSRNVSQLKQIDNPA